MAMSNSEHSDETFNNKDFNFSVHKESKTV